MDPITIFLLRLAAKPVDKAIKNAWHDHKHRVATERQRQELAERAQRCCAECGTIANQSETFCHNCGAAAITTVGAIRDKQAVDERERQFRRQTELAAERLQREKQERERARRKAARERSLELLAARYCPTCNTTFAPTHKFCGSCGTATEVFLPTWAFEYAREEYPDVVQTEDDFRQLVK